MNITRSMQDVRLHIPIALFKKNEHFTFKRNRSLKLLITYCLLNDNSNIKIKIIWYLINNNNLTLWIYSYKAWTV